MDYRLFAGSSFKMKYITILRARVVILFSPGSLCPIMLSTCDDIITRGTIRNGGLRKYAPLVMSFGYEAFIQGAKQSAVNVGSAAAYLILLAQWARC